MPEISRFLGIIIYMYYRDHRPPHFHAEYGEYKISVEIESGVVEGKFPKGAKRGIGIIMLHFVTSAKYIRDYTVFLLFDDGKKGEVDLSMELDGEIFKPLENIDYFKKFKIQGHTLAWDNGADFAPEFLYDKLK